MAAKANSAACGLSNGTGYRSNCCGSSRFFERTRFTIGSGIAFPMENGSETSRHAPVKRRIGTISGQRVEITWEEGTDRIAASVNGRSYDLEKRELAPGKYWFGG